MQENNYTQPLYDEEQEIDIMELISKLWKKKTLIIKWCIAGAIVGLVVGFSIPKTYSSSVTLAPETQQRTNSSVSSIASMMGVNLNNSVDAISVEMFPDVVHSTPFIVELFDLPVQFQWKGETVNSTLLNYMLEYQKSPWWTPVMQFPFKVLGWAMSLLRPEEEEEAGPAAPLNLSNLPKKERGVVKFFAENIMVNVDKKTGKTSMSLQMQDPQVVATVMNAVVEHLKNYMSDYRTAKVRQDVENLSQICAERKADFYKAQQAYAKYLDANKSVVLQSSQAERERLQQEMSLAYQVYSQVATQLESARIQVQQAKPVFVIINPVTVPLNRTAPSKVKILLFFTIFAACCSAAWVVYQDKILYIKKRLNY